MDYNPYLGYLEHLLSGGGIMTVPFSDPCTRRDIHRHPFFGRDETLARSEALRLQLGLEETKYFVEIHVAGLWLIRLGYAVAACRPFEKNPNITPDAGNGGGFNGSTEDSGVFQAWHRKHPLMGIGIATPGLAVVDGDVSTKGGAKGIGDQTLAALIAGDASVLSPMRARSWSGGTHDFFRTTEELEALAVGDTKKKTGALGANLDLLRGVGGVFCAPTRIHADETGLNDPEPCPKGKACKNKLTCPYTKTYSWLPPLLVAKADLPEIPQIYIARKRERAEAEKREKKSGKISNRKIIPVGERNDALYSYLCSLRGKGGDVEDIVETAMRDFVPRCEGTVEHATVLDMATRICRDCPKGRGDQDGGQVERLIAACEERLTLFHTSDNETCASLEINGVRHTYRLDSREFRRALSWILRQASDKKEAPTEKTVSSVLPYLEGNALWDGPLEEVFLRVAGDAQTWIEIDIGDDTWTSVQINKKGWKVAPHTIRFVRSSSMKALPLPIKGGTIDELRRVIGNIKRDAVWALLVAYIVSALQPPNHGTYPILIVEGSEGSGKSELVKFLKKLIDPSRAKVRNLPHEQRDMPAAVYNNYCLAYENVSSIPQWLSDAWSSLATGDGFASRLMRTNKEEDVIEAHRPIMCNGITKFVTKADLLSRSVFVPLDPFTSDSDVKRLTKDDLYAAQDEAMPRILGAIYSLMAHVLAQRKAVHEEIGAREKPRHRLPEFEEIAHCIESELDIPTGTVGKALSEGERLAALTALDSPVGDAIRELLKEYGGFWQGLSRDFYKALTARAQTLGGGFQPKTWPKDAERLSNEIKRLEKSLTYAGFDYTKKPNKKGAMVTIKDRNHVSSTDSGDGDTTRPAKTQGDRSRRELHKRSRPPSEHPDRARRRSIRRNSLVAEGGT